MLGCSGRVGSRMFLPVPAWESGNPRMVGVVGRELWRPSSPTPLPRQGHLEQVSLEFSRGRIHSLPGQPVGNEGHQCGGLLPKDDSFLAVTAPSLQ